MTLGFELLGVKIGVKQGVWKGCGAICQNEGKTFTKEKTVDGKADILSATISKEKQTINPYMERAMHRSSRR